MQYLRIYETTNGGYVDLHPLHGADELPANSVAAIAMANAGHSIELLPSIAAADQEARLVWLSDVPGHKNPDVRIDGHLIGDIKTPNIDVAIKQSTINRCIYASAQQKVSVAIINLLKREYAIQDIKKGIIGALQPNRNKTIMHVWVITANGNIFKADRSSVFDESIYEMLNLL
jgi:hypothetical protein